jgi:hypothetical protein
MSDDGMGALSVGVRLLFEMAVDGRMLLWRIRSDDFWCDGRWEVKSKYLADPARTYAMDRSREVCMHW